MKTEKIAYRILDKNRKLFDLLAYEGNIPMPELDLQAIHEVVVKESPIRIPVSKGKMLDAIISKRLNQCLDNRYTSQTARKLPA